MWEITKEFSCDYGHRVHNQTLNQNYSIDNKCVCRHCHGHRLTLLVSLSGSQLKNGMVTDFKHLNWLKKFIDDVVDHKFILDINDPAFGMFLPDYTIESFRNRKFDGLGYWVIPKESYDTMPDYKQEIYEGYVIVDFVPTSENLSKWFYDIISERMRDLNVEVSQVKFYETPKSSSTYSV